MRIGIDLMGSDTVPKVLFDAILHTANSYNHPCTLIVLATPPIVKQLEKRKSKIESPNKIEFVETANFISMQDPPLFAIRRKKNSSLLEGIKMLSNGELDALISAGNTGAIIAGAALHLKHFSGVERPGLLAEIPTKKGSVAVIDVGGNLSCQARHLIAFAKMGAAFQSIKKKIPIPKIALLNIGTEAFKGHAELRKAHYLLSHTKTKKEASLLDFVGNVEGREVYEGKIDVLVTEGFAGNLFLKTSEGLSSFIFDYLQDKIRESKELSSVLSELKRSMNHHEYPGALICGVDAVLIKCHGHTTSTGMHNAIKSAYDLVQNSFIQKMKHHFENFLED